MTTAIPNASIIITKNRQRRGVGNCDDLIESIRRIGIISPICITRENVLVAGERRLFSLRKLEIDPLIHGVHFVYREELDPFQLEAIELEENIKRRDLSWQEEVAAIARYHLRRAKADPSWTHEKTADEIGVSRSSITKYLLVAEHAKTDGSVWEAQKFSVALNAVERSRSRSQQTLLDNLFTDEAPTHAEETLAEDQAVHSKADRAPGSDETTAASTSRPAPAPADSPFRLADSFEFFSAYTGAPFNFIHCDFPYGIDFQSAPRMNSLNQERYEDTIEVYKLLVESLLPKLPISDSAHMLFWFSMKHFEYTKLNLRNQGWTIDPFPLIWYRSDGKGLIPDTARRGRYVYETAFHCWRGDRKIVRPVNNVYACGRGDTEHPSTKPEEMLEHFFRMYVDDSSAVLDPTCGGGSAIRVAKRLGASRLLGVEKDPDFFQTAQNKWRDMPAPVEFKL